MLTLPSLLVATDASVLNLALPAISTSLHASSAQLLWIADSYGFFLAGSLLTMGALGDRVGRRRLLLIGATGFAAMSTLAAFSTTPGMLIAARAAQGVAAATLMPSTLALIRELFPDEHQRTRAVGVWLMALSSGGALGPLVGGALLDAFWWGAPFLLAVPLLAVLLVSGPRVLPEVRSTVPPWPDVASAVLSLATVLLLIGGIKMAARGGLSPAAGALLVAGVLLGAVFLRRQRQLREPLVALSLFRSPALSLALATNALGFCAAFGVALFTVEYLQLVLGYTPLVAGLLTIPTFVAYIGGAFLTPSLASRLSRKALVAGGLMTAAVGYSVILLVGTDAGLAALISGNVVAALGLSPVVALTTDTAVSAAPPERSAAAAALSETSTELGAALGLAVLGSLGAAVYRAVVSAAAPSGLTPADSTRLRSAFTSGRDLSATAHIPAAAISANHTALTDALQAVSVTAGAAMAATAGLTAFVLRARRNETVSEPALGIPSSQ